MIEWFKNLSDVWKIAVVTPVGFTAIGGLFALFKWLFSKKDATTLNTIQQQSVGSICITADETQDIAYAAEKDISPDVDTEQALNILVETSAKLGRTEEENKQLRQTVGQLEEQLAKPSLETNTDGGQSPPVPSAEAKELAKLISEDDGPYTQALKAIAEGNNEKADKLLDETQQLLDHAQYRKDKAQAKIYFAHMQKASYAGRPQEALQYCEKLQPLAGEDPQILNLMATVYYENAMYRDAESLMKRALAIDEASFGKDHPDVARDLNNLAQLLQATNRLSEAEELMHRALTIDEASFGPDHPDVARDLNNLAQLYQATNRLKEAESLMKRVLAIDQAIFGPDHPALATDLNNLAGLYQATNRLAEAEPIYRLALAIDEASLGSDHPNVATGLSNLAQLLRTTHRFAEAEPLMRRALKIDEVSFGPDHPNIAIRLSNIAALLKTTNRLSEAEPMLTRAVKILENSIGPDHPRTIAVRKNRDACRGSNYPTMTEDSEKCQ